MSSKDKPWDAVVIGSGMGRLPGLASRLLGLWSDADIRRW